MEDYLTFSYRDRIGVIVVLALVLVVYLLPLLFTSRKKDFPVLQGTVLSDMIDSLDTRTKTKDPGQPSFQHPDYSNRQDMAGELFPFDPNTLSPEGWKRLGLPSKTILTITHFCSKGGKFNSPEDLLKIWGLSRIFYERVKQFIQIQPSSSKNPHLTNSAIPLFVKPHLIRSLVNINDADTTLLISLPGIGSKLASRIVNFREKLGGFYSLEQVGEIYGLQDSAFQKIKPLLQVAGQVKKFHLNMASKEEFKLHPYFRWNLANAIVEFRNQHGNFENLEALRNIPLVDSVTFLKITPYLDLK